MVSPLWSVLRAPVHAQGAPPIDKLHKVCGIKPSNSCDYVFRHTHSQVLAKIADFGANRLLTIVVIWAVAFAVNFVLRRVITRTVGKLSGSAASGRLRRLRDRAPAALVINEESSTRAAARAQTIAAVVRSICSIVVYAFAAIYTASALGVQLGPLIAGAGVIGVAIGFGAQSLVKDFLSGIFMLLEDQYGVGDIVDVGQTTDTGSTVIGTIEAVSLRTTRLRDLNGVVWHIPNGEILRVGNQSQGWARAVLDISVAYDSDLEEVMGIIDQVAAERCAAKDLRSNVLSAPDVWGVQELGADGITVRLVVKTKPGAQFGVMRELRRAIKDAFDTHGVELPFPQRTVWIRGAPEPSAQPVT